ncbi:hypothetical protein [Streptomyces sp. NPDC053427]|uniref:hypothetical protein n=1 Tax=Streptomyces sp. NPDC053427 TaxID=3365701 RepID=UPI0037D91354
MRIRTILAAATLTATAVLGGASMATADDHRSHSKSAPEADKDKAWDTRGFVPDLLKDLGLVGE